MIKVAHLAIKCQKCGHKVPFGAIRDYLSPKGKVRELRCIDCLSAILKKKAA